MGIFEFDPRGVTYFLLWASNSFEVLLKILTNGEPLDEPIKNNLRVGESMLIS